MANVWSVLFVSYFPAHPIAVSKETVQVGTKPVPNRDQVTAQVLNFCQEPRKFSEIMELIGLKHWKTFQANYLRPLLQQELLAMTIPEKPTSSKKQRYITTKTGKEALKTENCAIAPSSYNKKETYSANT